MQKEESEVNRTLVTISMWLANILACIAIAIGGGLWNKVNAMDARQASIRESIAVMQGNRFTSSDGLAVWQAMADIKRDLASLPRESPPKWFEERVSKMENELRSQILDLRKSMDDLKRSQRP